MMKEMFIFNPIKKLYYQKEVKDPMIINKAFYRELAGMENTAEIFRRLNLKTCIIGAEKGAKEDAKAYFSRLRSKKSSAFSIIRGASHLFGSKRAKKELFQQTLTFLTLRK